MEFENAEAQHSKSLQDTIYSIATRIPPNPALIHLGSGDPLLGMIGLTGYLIGLLDLIY